MKSVYIFPFLFFVSCFALDDFQQAEKLYRATSKKMNKQPCHLDGLDGKSPTVLCFLVQQMMFGMPFSKRAVLLHGPAGVGKTAAIEAVVKHAINHSHQKGLVKIVSIASENDLQKKQAVIDKAKNGFIFLLIDGLDTMPEERRDELLHKVLMRVKENHNVGRLIMVATTSDPSALPESLRRQCFEVKIDLPDKKECEALFTSSLGASNVHLQKYINSFAKRAVNKKCSRREIQQIIERAQIMSKALNLSFIVKEALDDAFDQVVLERKEQEKLIKISKKEGASIEQWLLTIVSAAIPPILQYILSQINTSHEDGGQLLPT